MVGIPIVHTFPNNIKKKIHLVTWHQNFTFYYLRNLRIQKHVVNEHYAAADCAEIYKKASGLLLIELGPRVIKKPYAFLDTAGKKKTLATHFFFVELIQILTDWRINLIVPWDKISWYTDMPIYLNINDSIPSS